MRDVEYARRRHGKIIVTVFDMGASLAFRFAVTWPDCHETKAGVFRTSQKAKESADDFLAVWGHHCTKDCTPWTR